MKTKLNMIFRKDFKLHLYVVYTRFSTLWFDQRGFANIMGKHYLQSVHIKICMYISAEVYHRRHARPKRKSSYLYKTKWRLILASFSRKKFSINIRRSEGRGNSRSIYGGRREGTSYNWSGVPREMVSGFRQRSRSCLPIRNIKSSIWGFRLRKLFSYVASVAFQLLFEKRDLAQVEVFNLFVHAWNFARGVEA